MKIDINKSIKLIQDTFEKSIPSSKIVLVQKGFNYYVISGNNISKAKNNNKNNPEEINVINWFDDYWLYFEITFYNLEKESYQINLSISVFQGKTDDLKLQLFRAEWDNWEDNKTHPQPHWHIYPGKYNSDIFSDFETYIGLRKESEGGFSEFIETSQSTTLLEMTDFHFAINGQWAEKKGHIHKVENIDSLCDWITGLLGHIKEQLEYL